MPKFTAFNTKKLTIRRHTKDNRFKWIDIVVVETDGSVTEIELFCANASYGDVIEDVKIEESPE